jgi:hypothetical protein
MDKSALIVALAKKKMEARKNKGADWEEVAKDILEAVKKRSAAELARALKNFNDVSGED